MDRPDGPKPVYHPKFVSSIKKDTPLTSLQKINQKIAELNAVSKSTATQIATQTTAQQNKNQSPPQTKTPRFNDASEADLWIAFSRHRSLFIRNELIRKYINFAASIAASYRLPSFSQLTKEDLQQAARVGLIEAIEAFDYKLGYKFTTFAGRRVFGAVIDELRRMADFPRIIAKYRRELIPKIQNLTHELGRQPSNDDICKRYGEYLRPIIEDKLFSNSVYNQVEVKSDNRAGSDVVEVVPIEQCIENHRILSGSNRIHSRELEKKIMSLLPDEKQQLAIYGYYYMQATIGQIAKSIGCSTSTAGALRKKAIETLKSKMTREMLVEWIGR